MLLPLNNLPLYMHMFNTLLKVKEKLDIDIYCYCSDEKIKDTLPHDVNFLKRPISLDTDETLGSDISRTFCETIDADIYCVCHATSPFIKSSSIIRGIENVLNYDNDSAFSSSEVKSFVWYEGKPLNYNLDNIVKTQDITPIYIETCAFYVFKKNVIKNNRRIGNNPAIIKTSHIESIDIDTEDDYNFAKQISYLVSDS
jgi:CMP-N-acetylneuraminic acid synthetase